MTFKPMNADDCLAAMEATGDDAKGLLESADPKLITKFRTLDKALVAYLAEVRQHFPEGEYYTASGGFSLLLGPSHDRDYRPRENLNALIGSASISDGDW